MSNYSIGYVATVFFNGDKTKYKYAGGGEWECVEGCDSPARYQQLLNMIND
jgi:hypothetical protein